MRKVFSILLCGLLLAALAVPVCAAEKADVVIRDAEEFLAFAENCRLDSYSMDLTVSLEADLDLAGTDFAGIPIFCGTFLGNGHSISGLEITGYGSEQGLFRYLTDTALVQDLHVTGTVAPQGSRSYVGGIAGSNAGTIKNCSFSGEITGSDYVGGMVGINTLTGILENCRLEGVLHGNHFVGGMAGANAGVIQNCENSAAINTTPKQNSVEISDITVETITGTESANIVTDLGGIAGENSGTIRGCINRGDVGYKHMGYNIGGVAGNHSGYLTECENFGSISGRKEIGGIVGHMEPSVLLRFDADTLQLLKAEMEILSGLMDRAKVNIQNHTAAIKGKMAALENSLEDLQSIFDILTIDPNNPTVEELDAYIAALRALERTVTDIGDTLADLSKAVGAAGSALEKNLEAISQQMEVINGILDNSGEHLGGSVTDVSDADTEEDFTSKLEKSVNHGFVLGDLNVGGIAGAMGLENDLDPEEDVIISGSATLNAQGNLRCVVRDCTNAGAVSAKKQNAGGIVGWQSMGLVKDCLNTGDLSSNGADYVGGIAGQSLGYIRSSHSKCSLVGAAYVGGIAGSGAVVTDCRSMVTLSGTERLGAILGSLEDSYSAVEEPVSGNLYVFAGNDPGAVDGINYSGKAEPSDLKTFLALADLPESFRGVTVTFVFDDGTRQMVTLASGDALPVSSIPEVPAREGYSGLWDGLAETNLDSILFDTAFAVKYISYGTTLAGSELREGRPVLLVQGDFAPDAAVTLTEPEDLPELGEKETLVGSWQIAVSNAERISGVRLLLPEAAKQVRVYIRAQDGWHEAEHTVLGSYAVADFDGGEAVALVRTVGQDFRWDLAAAIGAGAAVVIAGVFLVIRKRRKPSARKEAPKQA